MNFTAKLALVLALLTLPVFGQSTGLPAPGVTAASCASGYFVTGWNATTGVPSCAAGSTGVAPTQRGVNAVADEGFVADNTTDNGPKLQAWDITTPANLAYATMSTATPWVMTLHGTGTDVVKWHCDLVGQ